MKTYEVMLCEKCYFVNKEQKVPSPAILSEIVTRRLQAEDKTQNDRHKTGNKQCSTCKHETETQTTLRLMIKLLPKKETQMTLSAVS